MKQLDIAIRGFGLVWWAMNWLKHYSSTYLLWQSFICFFLQPTEVQSCETTSTWIGRESENKSMVSVSSGWERATKRESNKNIYSPAGCPLRWSFAGKIKGVENRSDRTRVKLSLVPFRSREYSSRRPKNHSSSISWYDLLVFAFFSFFVVLDIETCGDVTDVEYQYLSVCRQYFGLYGLVLIRCPRRLIFVATRTTAFYL